MTQPIQRHHTNTRMSKIVQYGGMVYLCGQTSSGSPVHDVAEQTREVLSRIDALLSEVGTDRSRILTATIYLKSIADFATMNAVWESWMPQGCAPARTTVEAALAAESLLVEITIAAAA
jgi:enamine deaminase RidA (YjgF/YER057c/UK114 family)